METKYQLTKRDYNEYIKTTLSEFFKQNIYTLIIVPIILAFLIPQGSLTIKNFVLTWVLSTLIINSIYLIYPYIRYRHTLKKYESEGKQLYSEKTLTATETGIRLKTNDVNLDYNWNSIQSIASSSEYIFIYFHDNHFLIIPNKSFQDGAQLSNFIALIRSKISPRISSAFDKPVLKPPYYLGLFCIIPFIGFIFGIYLIVTGIFKYRNNWLIIFGLSGIIISVVIGAKIREAARSQEINEAIPEVNNMINTDRLNDLVKEIEFYKLIMGNYPKDLAQLQTLDKKLVIHEFFIGSEESQLYYYTKIGEKNYSIFATGLDRKPYTGDDIHPNIVTTDSSTIGLIIK